MQLFQGKLMIAVRDVNKKEYQGADQELEKNMEIITQNDQNSYMQQLFNGKIQTILMSYFEDALFENDIYVIRENLLGLARQNNRWISSQSILSTMKILLVQLHVTDNCTLEEHEQKLKIEALNKKLNDMWNSYKQESIEQISFFDSQKTYLKLLDASENGPFQKIQTTNHNEVVIKLEQFIQNILELRANQILQNFDAELKNITNCNENQTKNNYEVEKQEQIKNLQKLKSDYKICQEKCSSCFLKCIQRKDHVQNNNIYQQNYLSQSIKQIQDNLCELNQQKSGYESLENEKSQIKLSLNDLRQKFYQIQDQIQFTELTDKKNKFTNEFQEEFNDFESFQLFFEEFINKFQSGNLTDETVLKSDTQIQFQFQINFLIKKLQITSENINELNKNIECRSINLNITQKRNIEIHNILYMFEIDLLKLDEEQSQITLRQQQIEQKQQFYSKEIHGYEEISQLQFTSIEDFIEKLQQIKTQIQQIKESQIIDEEERNQNIQKLQGLEQYLNEILLQEQQILEEASLNLQNIKQQIESRKKQMKSQIKMTNKKKEKSIDDLIDEQMQQEEEIELISKSINFIEGLINQHYPNTEDQIMQIDEAENIETNCIILKAQKALLIQEQNKSGQQVIESLIEQKQQINSLGHQKEEQQQQIQQMHISLEKEDEEQQEKNKQQNCKQVDFFIQEQQEEQQENKVQNQESINALTVQNKEEQIQNKQQNSKPVDQLNDQNEEVQYKNEQLNQEKVDILIVKDKQQDQELSKSLIDQNEEEQIQNKQQNSQQLINQNEEEQQQNKQQNSKQVDQLIDQNEEVQYKNEQLNQESVVILIVKDKQQDQESINALIDQNEDGQKQNKEQSQESINALTVLNEEEQQQNKQQNSKQVDQLIDQNEEVQYKNEQLNQESVDILIVKDKKQDQESINALIDQNEDGQKQNKEQSQESINALTVLNEEEQIQNKQQNSQQVDQLINQNEEEQQQNKQLNQESVDILIVKDKKQDQESINALIDQNEDGQKQNKEQSQESINALTVLNEEEQIQNKQQNSQQVDQLINQNEEEQQQNKQLNQESVDILIVKDKKQDQESINALIDQNEDGQKQNKEQSQESINALTVLNEEEQIQNKQQNSQQVDQLINQNEEEQQQNKQLNQESVDILIVKDKKQDQESINALIDQNEDGQKQNKEQSQESINALTVLNEEEQIQNKQQNSQQVDQLINQNEEEQQQNKQQNSKQVDQLIDQNEEVQYKNEQLNQESVDILIVKDKKQDQESINALIDQNEDGQKQNKEQSQESINALTVLNEEEQIQNKQQNSQQVDQLINQNEEEQQQNKQQNSKQVDQLIDQNEEVQYKNEQLNQESVDILIVKDKKQDQESINALIDQNEDGQKQNKEQSQESINALTVLNEEEQQQNKQQNSKQVDQLIDQNEEVQLENKQLNLVQIDLIIYKDHEQQFKLKNEVQIKDHQQSANKLQNISYKNEEELQMKQQQNQQFIDPLIEQKNVEENKKYNLNQIEGGIIQQSDIQFESNVQHDRQITIDQDQQQQLIFNKNREQNNEYLNIQNAKDNNIEIYADQNNLQQQTKEKQDLQQLIVRQLYYFANPNFQNQLNELNQKQGLIELAIRQYQIKKEMEQIQIQLNDSNIQQQQISKSIEDLKQNIIELNNEKNENCQKIQLLMQEIEIFQINLNHNKQEEQQKKLELLELEKLEQKYLKYLSIHNNIEQIEVEMLEFKEIQQTDQLDLLQQRYDELNKQIEALESQELKIQTILDYNQLLIEKAKELEEINNKITQQHNCGRNSHKCDQICECCSDDKIFCKYLAGHEHTAHLCENKDHFCKEKCRVQDCKKQCQHYFQHDETQRHDCKELHPCNQKCQYNGCLKICSLSAGDPHNEHKCEVTECPHECYFQLNFFSEEKKCHNKCSYQHTQNHDVHICGSQKHQCNHVCELQGVCKIETYSEIDKSIQSEDGLSTFNYKFIVQNDKKIQCQNMVDALQIMHEGQHICNQGRHTCDQRCPECNAFCNEAFGHKDGKHKPHLHRNKDVHKFTALVGEENEQSFLQNEDQSVVMLKVGQSCEPETCSKNCFRRSRAHFHLLECDSNQSNCQKLNKKYKKNVAHHQLKKYIGSDKIFDEVLCEYYWDYLEWEIPVDKNLRNTISQCNYYCNLCEGKEPIFCSQEAWHDNTDEYLNHSFSCADIHKNIEGVDVQFVIDTTGSMQIYIDLVKKTINRLILASKNLISQDYQSILFSIISYKDHYDSENKDSVCKSLDFNLHEKAINFLNELVTEQGGDTPEAMLDGLHEASKQKWRQDSKKFLFLIADSPPHGSQYHNMDDDFPHGCPCGLKENEVLQKLRDKNIKVIFYMLNDSLNQTFQSFRRKLANLEDVRKIEDEYFMKKIQKLVCQQLKIREVTIRKQ